MNQGPHKQGVKVDCELSNIVGIARVIGNGSTASYNSPVARMTYVIQAAKSIIHSITKRLIIGRINFSIFQLSGRLRSTGRPKHDLVVGMVAWYIEYIEKA